MTARDRPLSELIVDQFTHEGFLSGERIGSERSLAEGFGVPRSDVRAALDTLEREGRVRRTRGSSGHVFLWDGKIERRLNTVVGVPELLRQQGIRSSTTVLSSNVVVANSAERRALKLAEGDTVYRLFRRRDADDVPLSLDSMSLPTKLLPGFRNSSHEGSVYSQLLVEYGIEAVESSETIDVTAASDEQARLLDIVPGDALLEIRRIAFDQSGTPFEYSRDFFRADRTRITMRGQGSRSKRAT